MDSRLLLHLFFVVFLFSCVRVCVYLCMYVRAYLAIPCVSTNDNVKHIRLNVRYVFDKNINKIKQNEINVKYIRIHVYEYTKRMLAGKLPYRDRKLKYIKQILNKIWR